MKINVLHENDPQRYKARHQMIVMESSFYMIIGDIYYDLPVLNFNKQAIPRFGLQDHNTIQMLKLENSHLRPSPRGPGWT